MIRALVMVCAMIAMVTAAGCRVGVTTRPAAEYGVRAGDNGAFGSDLVERPNG